MSTSGAKSSRQRCHFTRMANRFSGMAFSALAFFSIFGSSRAVAEVQFRCADMFANGASPSAPVSVPGSTPGSIGRLPVVFAGPEINPVELALMAFLRSRTSTDLLSEEELGPDRAAVSVALRSNHQPSPAGTNPLTDPSAGWLADAYVIDVHRTRHVIELLTISSVPHPRGPHWFELERPRRVVAISLIVRTSAEDDRRQDAERAAERSRGQMLERIALAVERHMPLLSQMVPWLRERSSNLPHFDRIVQPDGVTEDVIAFTFDAGARSWLLQRVISEQSFRGFIATLLDRSQ